MPSFTSLGTYSKQTHQKKVVVNTLLLFRTLAKFKPYYLTIFLFMPHTKLYYKKKYCTIIYVFKAYLHKVVIVFPHFSCNLNAKLKAMRHMQSMKRYS